METNPSFCELAVASFLEALREHLPDLRDSRGKRHTQEFTLVAVSIALMCRSSKLSSIHRFMKNRLEWLRCVTGMPTAEVLSRSYLPHFLSHIDRTALCVLIEVCFGVKLSAADWYALDGKVLRGSSDEAKGEREAVAIAVSHSTKEEVYQLPQSGVKASEVLVVRTLLAESGLESQHVTFDALHCCPETLQQVAAAGGTYLTQVKGNQPELFAQCCTLATQEPALAKLDEADKSHGRRTVRKSRLHVIRPGAVHKRWDSSEVRYLVVMLRETYKPLSDIPTVEASYYISNAETTLSSAGQLRTLTDAIRNHWGVESNNYVRDTTLGEDLVRARDAGQSQVLSVLRSLTLNLLRRTGALNIQAKLERLSQVPADLEDLLRRNSFL